MRSTLACLLATSVLLGGLSARSEDTDEEARVQFEQGIAFYRQGDYEQAAIAFERAYQLKPSYKILYNVGQVENELEHYAAALIAYRRYLDEGGDEVDGERRGQVEGEIDRLDSLVGIIEIACPEEGAKIKVDNEARGKTPLAEPLYVDIGKHEITVVKGREELFDEIVKIAGGQRLTIEVEGGGVGDASGGASGAEGGSAGASQGEGESGGGELWTWGWVAVGVGGAALAGGVVTGAMAASVDADLEENCEGGTCPPEYYDDVDEYDDLSLTTNILLGVGGAIALAGAVMLIVDAVGEGDGAEDGAPEEETASIAPAVGPGYLGVAVSRSF